MKCWLILLIGLIFVCPASAWQTVSGWTATQTTIPETGYTGWGDDLWQFNTETGNYNMPLQYRPGKVQKIREKNYNIFVTGSYTPDDLRLGPAPNRGFKFSVSLLKSDE